MAYDKTQKLNQTPQQKSKGPDYRACVGTDNKDKTFWTTIGSAWITEKGGISIKLNAAPIGDSMILFPIEDEKAK
jgi:hypothetical protein